MSGKFDWSIFTTWLVALAIGVWTFFVVVTGMYWFIAI